MPSGNASKAVPSGNASKAGGAMPGSEPCQMRNEVNQCIMQLVQSSGISPQLLDTLIHIIFTILAVPISILLKLLLERSRKQFWYHYSKACLRIVNKTTSELNKARYLKLSLNCYNNFLKRNTGSQIYDIETVYSKILSNSQLSNNILVDTIIDSFNDRDELKPMRHMLTLLSYWREGAGLVKPSLKTKIKESSDLLIPIVGVVITILSSFFLPRPGSSP
jgi:hypothetical protein